MIHVINRYKHEYSRLFNIIKSLLYLGLTYILYHPLFYFFALLFFLIGLFCLIKKVISCWIIKKLNIFELLVWSWVVITIPLVHLNYYQMQKEVMQGVVNCIYEYKKQHNDFPSSLIDLPTISTISWLRSYLTFSQLLPLHYSFAKKDDYPFLQYRLYVDPMDAQIYSFRDNFFYSTAAPYYEPKLRLEYFDSNISCEQLVIKHKSGSSYYIGK